MAKTRTTLTIDEDILKSARIAAASRGIKEGELIEEALTRYLGYNVFELIWADNANRQFEDGIDFQAMSDDELLQWAVDVQHEARRDWLEGKGGPSVESGH